MLNTAFEPWPSFTPEEANAVQQVLLSNRVNYWTGQECREFEKEFAHYVGTPFAVALANGTVALDVALKALGIGAGDDVIVTSRTFLASASSIVTAGANPIFADVELDSQNISRRTIEAVLTDNTKAIICVHLAGWMCDMDPIMQLAEEKGIYVIEDCAQAHGAMYKGRAAGSIGHIGAWSFCQDKIMTTGGEGGMVTTHDEQLWKKMWSYKDHGKNYDSIYHKQHPPGFRWLHDSFGTNWRMMEMQAVIGRIQLRRMSEWTQKRYENAQQLFDVFKKSPYFTVHEPSVDYQHAYYKCYVQVNTDALPEGWSRDRIMHELNSLNVPCFSGSCSEVYLEHAFDHTPWRPQQRLVNAQKLGETSLMFLVHPTLSNENMNTMLEAIQKVQQMIE
ncbi:DegT/DnrJ/EryC1/StrS family aminotransferase [Acinetobacter junii]|jgi:dTDP-4-amino-4,6-dideoxygalactose transaminase|uniref:DegT/DnrJ/EryC1/StrS family aminotransferase n=1 Tax=Acinetobacter junii TaxID=40215 RepID=UPI0005B3206B|nr:DegT/DnrJ/EryC1/StrS aminotransferase family protein [Acinetobacter junii]MDH0667048.1 DegT/DnrJ/EryC1/StrS aminotransferase family protein [Acinetobacter junii]MDH1003624.1 DegT/DnrJ/EryC1/StrS aminotransferase family protein [Acinetobacter junii]MDH1376089.1 DegT/DnrJ/EryC1/StrS aminotransferase family protein [Acinetobacter junii]MDH1916125.1 DegT/DnrJ/EryC1/StrS aminotransferase family protein [Acinetobacter junii]MDU2407885.1 DegT/DnrJ/EryC1/StrS aminotransferase family protein [Acinet